MMPGGTGFEADDDDRPNITMRLKPLKVNMLRQLLLLVTLISSADASWKKIPTAIYTRSRRILNFSSLFGAPTYASPYDRITGHPVFSVTTPWGSPYMNMEKLSDLDEVVKTDSSSSSRATPQSISEEQNEFRTVALYFMDPDDALGVHGEMKQMEQMESADLRLTTFSLAKALRQASNLGHGLPTGFPPNANDGNFKLEEGACLRYKIVPPKRQLYYAARCIGKERVGLFSESPQEDAQAAVMGNSALEGLNLIRRREKRERKTTRKPRNAMEAANMHMEGYCGIPVFYAPELKRQLPLVKRIISGNQHEIPLFFNYEDMVDAWERVKKRNNPSAIPDKPSQVEVFNLWDVLTSMDRDANLKAKTKWQNRLVEPLRRRFTNKELDINDITFVPSSRSVRYKEAISARGNGKARLRPMR